MRVVEGLKWAPAPVKTEWGEGMMVADVALDRDSTLTLYCHVDDLGKVVKALAGTLGPSREL